MVATDFESTEKPSFLYPNTAISVVGTLPPAATETVTSSPFDETSTTGVPISDSALLPFKNRLTTSVASVFRLASSLAVLLSLIAAAAATDAISTPETASSRAETAVP